MPNDTVSDRFTRARGRITSEQQRASSMSFRLRGILALFVRFEQRTIEFVVVAAVFWPEIV